MAFFHTSDGFRLFFHESGTGMPVLLIHGFASNSRVNWQETGWIRHLTAARMRVIAPDNLGHGQSAPSLNRDDYAPANMARHCIELLDFLHVSRAAILGYSMGARIAGFMASAYPERMTCVIFGGLGGALMGPMSGSTRIARALRAPHGERIDDPVAFGYRRFAERTGSDLAALAACIEGSRTALPAAMVARINIPALVIVGAEDTVCGPGEALAALLPNGRAEILAGCDHMKATGDRRFKEKGTRFIMQHGLEHPEIAP